MVNEIRVQDLNRPGLALTGFFDNFGLDRIQIFGRGEHAYLLKLDREGVRRTIETFFERPMPCVIFTHELAPPPYFHEVAEAAAVPILQSELSTSEFAARLIRALSNVFAQKDTVHGVLVEVFGIGVLITGDSGVGKSETALELIERGHRLVADDVVEIRCVAGNILLGQPANQALGHHMEIRGLGIINITHIFGVGAIRDSKQVQLVVELEHWDAAKEYDRIGAEDRTIDLVGVKTPHLQMPVRPGRNVPVLIETAAMNERLKKLGYHSARDFNQSVLKWLESENARKLYFQNRGGDGTAENGE